MKLVVEPFEIRGEPGLRCAVKHDRRTATIARDGAHHDKSAALRQETGPRLLAERDRRREIDVEQTMRPIDVGFEGRLRCEVGGREHDGVDRAERGQCGVEGGRDAGHITQITGGGASDVDGGSPCQQIARRFGEIVEVASEEKEAIAALREAACDGAANPLGRAEQNDVHGASPIRRTDCALRSRPLGSQRRRMARNSSSRGSIAR